MTESEWLKLDSCYHVLQGWRLQFRGHGWPTLPRPSDRRLRLFACACVRLCDGQWDDPLVLQVCDLTEQFADARTNTQRRTIKDARKAVQSAWPGVGEDPNSPLLLLNELVRVNSIEAAYASSSIAGGKCGPACTATLLRDIVGNPFRPVTFDPAWRSESAVALASAIYADRAFDRMPILADALEEAGCDHADILHHCRDPEQPHARGCWVVDLVLGKS